MSERATCPCGREVPASSPSDDFCNESCQSAWMMHQLIPDYPTPAEIREAAEQRVAQGASPSGRLPFAPRPEPPRPRRFGMSGANPLADLARPEWQPFEDPRVSPLVYRRWCPACGHRVDPINVFPVGQPPYQLCDCGHAWPTMLIGSIEHREDPLPALRLRLSDRTRSATHIFSLAALEQARDAPASMWLTWEHLERELDPEHRNDQDRATDPDGRASRAARRRAGRVWAASVPPAGAS